MPYDLVIENGTIVDPIDGMKVASIGINGERIEVIGGELRGEKHVDAHGCYVFPGFIDPHVHLRDFEWAHKETYATGSRAAAHGGVTTVADMPNLPKTPTTYREQVLDKLVKAGRDGVIDILVFCGVTKDNIDCLHLVSDAVCGYKIFMCESTGGLYLPEEHLERAMRRIAELGKPVSVHCEDETINRERLKEYSGRDLSDLQFHNFTRPPESEAIAIWRALECAKRTGARANICHVSTLSGAYLAEQYQAMFEVTPHHIIFNAGEKDRRLKVNPPLRPDCEQAALSRALSRAQAFMLASDHAPHTPEEKAGEKPASGIPSVDRYGNLVVRLMDLLSFFTPVYAARATSYNAAQWFGLDDRGRIAPGFLADIAVIRRGVTESDLQLPKRLYTKCGWDPYDGIVAENTVAYTIKRGKVIAEGGKVLV